MKTISAFIIGLLFSVSAFAQTSAHTGSNATSPVAAVKSSLDGNMYEIVGRADSNNIILHLNKETGEVKFISNDKYIKILRQESPEDVAETGRINYQIVMSSNTVYLLNLNTGVTWYMKSPAMSYLNTKFVLITEKK